MKQCLIVDDSRTMRKIMHHMVSTMGFECRQAENGFEAEEQCKILMPDLITLDWNMPECNGLEFIKILRAMENGHHPCVIFCTTENEMSFIESALTHGGNEYVMKPFDRSVIESKLMQLGMIEDTYPHAV